MQSLQLTVVGMQNPEEKVALQAVEFWSTVCDEEAELLFEAQEVRGMAVYRDIMRSILMHPLCVVQAEAAEDVPSMESQNFAKIALPEILPQLLTLMQKQDEDAEDDEWNVAMAAGTCVGLLATVVGDDIVPLTIPFIEQNIQAANWNARDAAVMVFGSILDGPDVFVLQPLVLQALPTIIQMMNDSHPSVRDSVAWTLGRITDLMAEQIRPADHLPELMKVLIAGLQQSGRIAASSCWSIKNLAINLSEYDGPNTSVLTPYYGGMLEALMNASETR
jgi:importin subunit beta-1